MPCVVSGLMHDQHWYQMTRAGAHLHLQGFRLFASHLARGPELGPPAAGTRVLGDASVLGGVASAPAPQPYQQQAGSSGTAWQQKCRLVFLYNWAFSSQTGVSWCGQEAPIWSIRDEMSFSQHEHQIIVQGCQAASCWCASCPAASCALVAASADAPAGFEQAATA